MVDREKIIGELMSNIGNWIFLVKTPEGFAGFLWKRSSAIQGWEKIVYGVDLDTGKKTKCLTTSLQTSN